MTVNRFSSTLRQCGIDEVSLEQNGDGTYTSGNFAKWYEYSFPFSITWDGTEADYVEEFDRTVKAFDTELFRTFYPDASSHDLNSAYEHILRALNEACNIMHIVL